MVRGIKSGTKKPLPPVVNTNYPNAPGGRIYTGTIDPSALVPKTKLKVGDVWGSY